MLVYHPYADINHGAFRALLLRKYALGPAADMDYWRILDFLYLFPHKARSLTVPRKLVKQRNAMGAFYRKYNDVHSPKEFLAQMKRIHRSIAHLLAAKGIIDLEAMQRGSLVWNRFDLPLDLELRLDQRAEDHKDVLDFLGSLAAEVPARGPNGIKARTGWLEHRYDA